MAQQNRKTTKKNIVDRENKKQAVLKNDREIKKPKNNVEIEDEILREKVTDEHMITSIDQKVKVLNDVSTVEGTLHKGEIVKVESAIHVGENNLKVIDNLGRFWVINSKDISTKV